MIINSCMNLKKSPQNTKDHVAIIFDPLMLVVDKKDTYLNKSAAKICRFWLSLYDLCYHLV